MIVDRRLTPVNSTDGPEARGHPNGAILGRDKQWQSVVIGNSGTVELYGQLPNEQRSVKGKLDNVQRYVQRHLHFKKRINWLPRLHGPRMVPVRLRPYLKG